MSIWTRERRTQVVLLVIGTVGVVAFLWFSVVSGLREWLKSEQLKLGVARTELQTTELLVASADRHLAEARRLGTNLVDEERRMAHGDVYRWVMNRLLELEERHAVRFMTYDPPQVEDFNLPPKVPYRLANYSATGIGHYADIGSLVADMENNHPYVRLNGLSIQAYAPGLILADDPQQLQFRLEFSSLITTNDIPDPP